jgi:hypothetical protein
MRQRRRVPWQYVAAGASRGPRYSDEERDCVVRAIMSSANIPYEDAHTICDLAGRKKGHGTNVRFSLDVGKQLGFLNFEKMKIEPDFLPQGQHGTDSLFQHEELLDSKAKWMGGYWITGRGERTLFHRQQPTRRITVGMVLNRLPAGRYVMATRTHAFAVVNGIVLDAFPVGLSASCEFVYRIW